MEYYAHTSEDGNSRYLARRIAERLPAMLQSAYLALGCQIQPI